MLLASFVWANRGQASDQFDAAFGAGTAANAARAVVDAALDNWSRVVTDFNHGPGIGPPDFSINIAMNPGNAGCGASASAIIGADGKSMGGNMTINFCDGDGDGASDWFLDPTPWENSEFQGTIVNAYSGDAQAGSPALGRGDLLTVVTHELGHAMGIAWGSLMSGGFVTETTTPDDAEGGGVGNFWVFQGPSVNVLLSGFDSGDGGQDFGAPVHSAGNRGGAANNALNFGGLTLYGAQEHMNAFYEFSRRYLLSDKIALMVKDAFDLDIIEPEIFGTFYATLNDTTGELLVRGGNDNTQINGVNQGASSDTIVITRDGDRIVVSMDAGVDVPGTGNGTHPLDQQDAFVSEFDLGKVRSIRVLAGDGNDNITLGSDLGVPTFVDAGDGNDSVIGGDITVFGGPGNDYIVGSIGADYLDGGAGDDILLGLEGNDTLFGGLDNDQIFGGPGDNSVAQASGDGDDLVDLSENSVALNYTVVAGNDTVIGSAFDDRISGGPGSDRLEGRAGKDVLDGDAGSNTLLGGADSDIITTGEDSLLDTVDGGTGDDAVNFRDGEGDYVVSRFNSLVVQVSRLSGASALLTDVEELNVGPTTFASTSTYDILDQSDTSLRVVNVAAFRLDGAVGLGVPAAITLRGSVADDTIDVAAENVGMVAVMPWGLVQSANNPAVLVVLGLEGDDNIKVGDLGATAITLDGGDGDDYLTADAVINGGAGNDTLIGGAGADTLNGGAGEDTMVGAGGADTYDGGADFDTILISGTSGNDRIIANQAAATTLTYIVNGVTETDTLVTVAGVQTVERARIEADSGDDLITVTWADSLGTDATANGLRFDVVGGADFTRDRLGVIDAGTGDLVLYRQGETDGTGSMTVGPANSEPLEAVFQGIEYAEPVAATDGDVVVFKPDPFEFNNLRGLATHLGADGALNVDPTIDPGSDAESGLPGDEDFYRVEALATGTLDLQVFFDEIPTVASGRPGLPGNGNLDIELYDRDGTLIAGSGPAFGGNDGGGTNPELNLDGDPAAEDERIRIPAVQGQVYYLRVFGAFAAAINNYTMTIINEPAPVPFDLELQDSPVGDPPPLNSDTGRSQFDNITRDNTPTLFFRLDDGILLNDLPGNNSSNNPPDEVIPIPFAGTTLAAGYRIAVFDEGSTPGQAGTPPQTPLGFAVAGADPGVYTFTTPALADGSHFLTARVQMIDPATPAETGFGARSQALEIVVDTAPPPVYFGSATIADDGLDPASDSGTQSYPSLFVDRLTNDTTPSFFGTAEADAIVRMWVDVDGNTGTTADDIFLGETVAVPLDGTNSFPAGQWNLQSTVDLNNPAFFPHDGTRRILVTAEDVAGNVSEPQVLLIFVDTQGPQITDVHITGVPSATYNLFGLKPENASQGPTPPVESLTIELIDQPARDGVNFANDVAILAAAAATPGNFVLVGDATGIIAIQQIIVTNDPVIDGQPATATIELVFAEPLPDDRFTLTLKDSLVDLPGNRLDGESNAAEPNGSPYLPSGDGVPGGDFVARFTVDSRPEVGVTAATRIYVDINQNWIYDPAGSGDETNRDLIFQMGLVSDAYFAGNFLAAGAGVASGFDKLGAYGWDPFAGVYRFLLDFNHNGVPDFMSVATGLGTSAIPVAGDFAAGHDGDEIGLFTGAVWYLDTNGDNVINVGVDTAIPTAMRGIPAVGDVNGDGSDDLITYDAGADRFWIDLNRDGVADDSIQFGIPDFVERPVIGDLNLDGVEDLGLWVAGNEQKIGEGKAEWYFLLSDRTPDVNSPPLPLASSMFDPYSPDPLGNDLFANFGDRYSLPIFGNFDPPAAGRGTGGGHLVSYTNRLRAVDVSGDGWITPLDALLVINRLNDGSPREVPDLMVEYDQPAPYWDVNGDRFISPLDALNVINFLNRRSGGGGEGESLELVQVDTASTGMVADSSTLFVATDPSSVGGLSGHTTGPTAAVYTVTVTPTSETLPWTGTPTDRTAALKDRDAWSDASELEEVLDLIADEVTSIWWT